MAIATVGIKLDEAIRERLKAAAAAQGETPHRAMKRMIVAGLERLERGEPLEAAGVPPVVPFLDFAQDVQPQSVNRNMVGAVVGVQPFGGSGLSGTGPKAGGPLYLRRLLAARPALKDWATDGEPHVFWQFVRHLRIKHVDAVALTAFAKITPLGRAFVLPGPVGEQNTYRLGPRGRVLCVAATEAGLFRQIAAALATGNVAVVPGDVPAVLQRLPAAVAKWVALVHGFPPADVVLFDGDAAMLRDLQMALCDWPAVVPVYAFTEGVEYPLEFLLGEQVVSVNTAAAGGNAALMGVG